jgi:hypothetical protein
MLEMVRVVMDCSHANKKQQCEHQQQAIDARMIKSTIQNTEGDSLFIIPDGETLFCSTKCGLIYFPCYLFLIKSLCYEFWECLNDYWRNTYFV